MGLFDWLKGGKEKASPPSEAPPATDPAAPEPLPPIQAAVAHLPQRTAWIPETESGEGEAAGSRIGGRPFLQAGEDWPTCPLCGEALHLVVQLRSTELPEEVANRTGPGLFQVLYCLSECEVDGDGWEPFSTVHLRRRLPLGVAGHVYPSGRSLKARAITGWTAEADLPHWEDQEADLDAQQEAAFDDSKRPILGDKLAGWPYWVQGAEYPSCRTCGSQMEVLFQVDSNDNLDFMWGDVGVAHLSFCPDRPDELGFAWACH